MLHALRLWRRQPLLALAAILSLALGIGANTAIFSVLRGSVLRPLPFDEPERLVMVWETSPDNPSRLVAPANFVDWRRDTTAFEGLAAFDAFSATLSGLDEPLRLRAVSASGNFFDLLRTVPARGRLLQAADDTAGAAPVAVLTDGLWRRLFGGAPAALGRSLELDGRPHTIVGVLPAGFSMPTIPDAEIWVSGDRGVPRSFPFGGDLASVRDSHIIFVLGRLAPGATVDAAQAEVGGVMRRLAAELPDTNAGLGARLESLHESVVGDVRPLILLLQAAVALLLIIACANVAHLLLGLAAERAAEVAMRVSLGATRAHLLRQWLAEALVLALPGGVLGLLAAAWGLDALRAIAPAELPRIASIGIDRVVLGFTAGVTMLTALAFGIGPAWQTARSGTAPPSAGARVAGVRRVHIWHRAVVVVEMALAQVLLVVGGLLAVSFVAAERVDLGFASENRLAAALTLSPDRYLRPRNPGGEDRAIDPGPKVRFIEAVLARLRGQTGIRAVAAAFTAPLDGAPNRGFRVVGAPEPPPNQEPAADFQIVTADYFRMNGIRLLQGRVLADTDRAGTPPVAVVNRALVDRYLPGLDPIGQVVLFGGDERHQIVGVVDNARYRDVEQPADPTFYLPLEQNDERWPFLSFQVWYDAPSSAGPAAAALRAAIRAEDPAQPITAVRTYDDLVGQALAGRRFNTLLVTLFAGTALLLAAIGIFGVMGYAVTTRTRELGVRAALGASPASLRFLVLGEGAWLSAVAVVLGLAAAWSVTRFTASLLFGVAPDDLRTFVAVGLLLLGVGLVATWLPARRATRVNPMAALRES